MALLYTPLREMQRDQENAALNRYLTRTTIREKHLLELQTKNPIKVDTPDRLAFRKSLIQGNHSITEEKVQFGNEILPFNYLAKETAAGPKNLTPPSIVNTRGGSICHFFIIS
ncbi:hypothetical protein [Paenibacillus sp. FSL R7-0331]|uniref:hypothetical protein n=1 Tax=Paenibacillus sp. FSL R7-0331 TaxID=1536773 RepID=UPI0004F77DEC|nr:hypothetical protein [Paenibacillus sp. FSL R7-0331]AIQ51611.1 hypothetical protein R70331_08840 [Paenibacillus sp. FSL R7-0331]